VGALPPVSVGLLAFAAGRRLPVVEVLAPLDQETIRPAACLAPALCPAVSSWAKGRLTARVEPLEKILREGSWSSVTVLLTDPAEHPQLSAALLVPRGCTNHWKVAPTTGYTRRRSPRALLPATIRSMARHRATWLRRLVEVVGILYARRPPWSARRAAESRYARVGS
jgi:hypothetical protein